MNGLKDCFYASLCAAVVVGLGVVKTSGSYVFLNLMAALIAAAVTLFYALLLSPLFYAAHKQLSNFWYFLLHVLVGFGGGAIRAMSNPYAENIQHYIFNIEALLVSCASMAAWLYVGLFVPRSQKPTMEEHMKARSWGATILPAGLLGLATLLMIAPLPPRDTSCHNVRSSASPSVRIVMTVAEEEIPRMIDLYERFSADFNLAIRGHAVLKNSAQRNMCSDDVTITAGGVMKDGFHSATVYESIDGSGWEPMVSELICRLEGLLAAPLKFRGDRGEEIPIPKNVDLGCKVSK